jgi:hypothetical protein
VRSDFGDTFRGSLFDASLRVRLLSREIRVSSAIARRPVLRLRVVFPVAFFAPSSSSLLLYFF